MELTAPSSPEDYEGDTVTTQSIERTGETLEVKRRARTYGGRLSVRPEGGALEQSEVKLALGLLRQGVGSICEICSRAGEGDEESVEYDEALGSSGGALIAMTTVANDTPLMRELVVRFIQLPSWWTWLVPSFDVRYEPDFDAATAVSTPLGPGWRFPLEIKFKGDPAFYASITAIEPRGVLQMTAGIVEMVGFAPDRPEEVVRIRFVGAGAPTPDQAGGEVPIQAKLWRD